MESDNSPPQPASPPPISEQIWNLASAIKDFIADGMQTVNSEQYAARMEICDTCDQRGGSRCMNCGCLIPVKARARAWNCPLNKWPAVEST